MSLAVAELDLVEDAERLATLRASLCKKELAEFVRKAWPIIEPDTPLAWNWHHDLICADLEAMTRGETSREIFNIPPGTSKSILVTVMWPAWMWASNSSLRFLKASYSDHLSIRDNLKLRDIVMSSWYQEHYDVTLVDDQNQKKLFQTTAGGSAMATSVGGAGTGTHPNFIIIDDPITAIQARSDVEREVANQWFAGTISSRGVILDVRIAVVMQRLHEDDLSGYLLSKGGWKHLCLPMRYEPTRAKTDKDPGWQAEPRDPRRMAGALLWPSAFTEAKVRKLELDLGPFDTAGQLQQRPSPEGGGLFRREWLPIVDVVPVNARRVRGWDTAGTEGAGDWTVGVKMAEADGVFYIEDCIAEQLGPAGVDALMRSTAITDGIGCSQREEKEGGSAGVAVTAARAKSLVGVDYAAVSITGDKVTRAKPLRAQCEAMNVRLVRGAWNEDYIRELCTFPTGKHDDRVDASSCAFNAVLLEPVFQSWFVA